MRMTGVAACVDVRAGGAGRPAMIADAEGFAHEIKVVVCVGAPVAPAA